MTKPAHGHAPSSSSFCVENWFQWVIDAHAAGYSKADIRFALHTLELIEPMRRVLEEDAANRGYEQVTA